MDICINEAIKRIYSTDFLFAKPRYRRHNQIGYMLEVLAGTNPAKAAIKVIGQSLEGRSVYAFELGNKNANKRILWVANAHGEEMRGTEELLHIASALLSDDFLKEVFLNKFHFTIIPTINPDAREFNLRWAKDEIDLREYFLIARRTIADKDGIESDMEWGYPLSNDDHRIMRRPEAVALKTLIDNEKFDLYLDLHGALNVCNLGFWFLHGSGLQNREKTIEFLYSAGLRSGLPLIEREKMENDLCLKLKPGVHTLCTAQDILVKYAKEPKLVEWFKKECGASSLDYFLQRNPQAQCFVAELPTYYHEKFMDMTPSGRLRKDLRRQMLEKSLKRCNEILIPLLDEALRLSQHPIIKKKRDDVDNVSIPSINNSLSRLDEEHGDSIATMGEIREFEELYDYWSCPAFGRFGLSGVISRLPEEEKPKLDNMYRRCVEEAKKCVENVQAIGLRELSFENSVNLQARTCLGLTLTYFS